MRSQEREPHVMPAGGREIPMDMSEEPLCMEIYRKKTHMDMSQEPFYVEIYRTEAPKVARDPTLGSSQVGHVEALLPDFGATCACCGLKFKFTTQNQL